MSPRVILPNEFKNGWETRHPSLLLAHAMNTSYRFPFAPCCTAPWINPAIQELCIPSSRRALRIDSKLHQEISYKNPAQNVPRWQEPSLRPPRRTQVRQHLVFGTAEQQPPTLSFLTSPRCICFLTSCSYPWEKHTFCIKLPENLSQYNYLVH